MKSNILVRQFIQQTLKDFPWSYPEQETTLLELIDGILANRRTSWNGIVRWSFSNITVKKLSYLAHNGCEYLKGCFNSINKKFNTIDKRNSFYISIDDTTQQRYGSQVYGASVFKDHTNNGFMFGNTIVNSYVHSKTYLESSYFLYISEKYLKKVNNKTETFQTKVQLAQHHFLEKVKKLLNQEVPKNKIWLTIDSWYISEILNNLAKKWGINYLVGIKKNAKCNQFRKEFSLDKLFNREGSWRYITTQNTGSILHYKIKSLYFPKYGRCKVFAIKRNQEKRIHYYITNQLKMTIQSFNRHWKNHWQIERFHYYTKDYFGFEESYSGSKKPNHFQWLLSHLIYKLFWAYKKILKKNGIKITLERLWELYCLDYDLERAKKLVYSSKKRNLLIKKLETI